MQKLLRISPSGPILCTQANKPTPTLSSLPFLAQAFRNSPPQHPQMHTAATALRGGSAFTATVYNKPTSSNTPSRFNCCLCRCSVGGGNKAPLRAWPVLKDAGFSGYRPAWLHTSSDGSFSVSAAAEASKGLELEKGLDTGSDKALEGVDNGEAEKDSEEKPSKFSNSTRRQRASSSGGSVVAGNPDLLAIPGVGPRNLRKLVEKGIGGVAELKQLYRDKVLYIVPNFKLLCYCITIRVDGSLVAWLVLF